MNLKEAYATLEIPEGTSPEDAKKKYRELTKKLHPDVNKAPDAEDKFKKINEAYQCVQNGKGNDREDISHGGPWNGHFTRQQFIQLENIELHLTVDFKESILGCKKEVKYSRQAKCQSCDGAGEIRLNNGCTKCGGKGQTVVRQRGMVFVSTCTECHGKSSVENCKPCNGEGTVHTDVSVYVSVPAGVINNNILRLQGMGNYAGTFMGISDQYTDVFCHITVTPEANLSIEGKDVISNITISLLDALRGCKRSVKTIYGEQEIQIDSNFKNRDEVIIPHLGVSGSGNQRVIVNVEYPEDTNRIIAALIDEEI